MDGIIDINVPLDYIEFQIFPSQNRYEACVCYDKKIEKLTSGLLEHLLQHSAEVKKLHSNGSNASFKLQPPENISDTKWFTKSTLIRFLHIIGLSNILNITNAVKNEISQLEEVHKFQLSLYAKGTQDQLKNGESDNSYSNGTTSTPKQTEGNAEPSDASKDELLRAMELRIAALRGELVASFDQAAGFRYSVEEITDIEKFSHHFGSVDLRDSLRKYVELKEENQTVDTSPDKQNTWNDEVSGKEGKNHIKSSYSDTPVKYGVSPAKVAQIERRSSSESEKSFSSDEDQPSVERSRTLIRSASPRRSASPMRRVQIGRSGSRRSTALTIKSLNYFPARERSVLPKDPDLDNSDEEANKEAPKKSENNVLRRMSVQDAISLFESKQKDQTTDIQKARSLLSASVGANKSVLRRWSSAVGENSQCSPDMDSEDAVPSIPNNLENREISHSSPEPEPEPVEPCGVGVTLNSPGKGACNAPGVQEESLPSQLTEVSEKLNDSAEWSRQKEAELNKLLMKMMETKPVKYRNVVPDKSKSDKLPNEQRGGQYNHYKEKREEKLRGETTRKRVEKEKQFRAMQNILDSRKAEMASPIVSQAGKLNNIKKVQKSQKILSQSANPKSESTNSGVMKKAVSKSSSLPATRKSWPSAPSPRAPGTSPAKIPAGTISTGTTPTRRRSQPASPVSRSTPKVDTSQPKSKPVKPNQNDSKKSGRSASDKKQQTLTKTRTPKRKVQPATEDPISSSKPSSYGKVTKKSSVVPLESKPFLRKGSGTISTANPAGKTKTSTQTKEPLRNSADLIAAGESEMVSNSSDAVIQQQEIETEQLKVLADTDSEIPAKSPHKCDNTESSTEVTPSNYNNSFDRMAEPEIKAEAEEESIISPTAWVKMEELDDQPITSGDSICQIESPVYVAPIRASSPRVRHSLSQMLLEESSEPDNSDWGNAENPPAMVYHKDAPKGLKRLLKFARKSKNDANTTGWSSPSVFSEGEDETDDSKFASKRSAENLLKKATLHSKNNGHQKASYETHEKPSADYVHLAQSNKGKYSVPSLSQQLQEGHVSASATATKATRSFFSLSAFKGSK
ncbi:serine/arginine repetitive matrix protein 1 [Abeliophyllum distichum]|uniref:Serine/arginine repetitive matrix protein 1 n=1 Tax=Abeliophyllum distichum TaxID=126358 RepID=A0ABD1UPB9_9LAMI